jgi:hypothetical protein
MADRLVVNGSSVKDDLITQGRLVLNDYSMTLEPCNLEDPDDQRDIADTQDYFSRFPPPGDHTAISDNNSWWKREFLGPAYSGQILDSGSEELSAIYRRRYVYLATTNDTSLDPTASAKVTVGPWYEKPPIEVLRQLGDPSLNGTTISWPSTAPFIIDADCDGSTLRQGLKSADATVVLFTSLVDPYSTKMLVPYTTHNVPEGDDDSDSEY